MQSERMQRAEVSPVREKAGNKDLEADASSHGAEREPIRFQSSLLAVQKPNFPF